MMFNYWRRQYDSLYKKYCSWVDQNNALIGKVAELEQSKKRLGDAFDAVRIDRDALERERDNLLNDNMSMQQNMLLQMTKIDEQEKQIQKLQRHINNIHSAFKVMQDVLDPPNKKAEKIEE